MLFGLLKKAVKKRPDLKLIVTSATLDSVKFSSYFYEAVSGGGWGLVRGAFVLIRGHTHTHTHTHTHSLVFVCVPAYACMHKCVCGVNKCGNLMKCSVCRVLGGPMHHVAITDISDYYINFPPPQVRRRLTRPVRSSTSV